MADLYVVPFQYTDVDGEEVFSSLLLVGDTKEEVERLTMHALLNPPFPEPDTDKDLLMNIWAVPKEALEILASAVLSDQRLSAPVFQFSKN